MAITLWRSESAKNRFGTLPGGRKWPAQPAAFVFIKKNTDIYLSGDEGKAKDLYYKPNA